MQKAAPELAKFSETITVLLVLTLPKHLRFKARPRRQTHSIDEICVVEDFFLVLRNNPVQIRCFLKLRHGYYAAVKKSSVPSTGSRVYIWWIVGSLCGFGNPARVRWRAGVKEGDHIESFSGLKSEH
eukprot:2021280-Rhodomonas_salina.3